MPETVCSPSCITLPPVVGESAEPAVFDWEAGHKPSSGRALAFILLCGSAQQELAQARVQLTGEHPPAATAEGVEGVAV